MRGFLPILVLLAVSRLWSHVHAHAGATRDYTALILVPAGPVSDQTRVELRVAVRHDQPQSTPITVEWFLDRVADDARIATQVVDVPAGKPALARTWWPTRGVAGRHTLHYRATHGATVTLGQKPLRVVSAETPGLPIFQGAWIEPLGVVWACGGDTPAVTEGRFRASVDAMHELGMSTLILTTVEHLATFYYPSKLAFLDREAGREARGADCRLDLVGTLLSQADRNGQQVFLGLGRSGDVWLLWEYDRPGWQARCDAAVATATAIAGELHERYGHHPSFQGWYLTHEMSDLARASAYYDPVARFVHALAPHKPVLIGPADVPSLPREVLESSQVDIFAYQDAVGAGYVPGRYTYDPAQALGRIDAAFTRYRGYHEGTDKHIWADLEVWQMDGKTGYGNAFPAGFDRVRQQIAIERRHVPVLTAYAWHTYLHDPARPGGKVDPRAHALFTAYRDWYAHQVRALGLGPATPSPPAPRP
jgi:hypothetical protein